MNWTIWILLSAVMLALYDIAKKASVRNNAVLPVLVIATFAGACAYIATVATLGDIAPLVITTSKVYVFSAIKTLIVGTSWILTYQALRTLPITIATPIRASAPAIVILLAIIIYGERPTWIQSCGMLFVFCGFAAFSWAGKHEGIDFLRNRAVWCAFGGMVMSAMSSLWDKYVFQISGLPVEAVQFWFQVDLLAFYLLIYGVRRLCGVRGDPFQWRWSIPLVGILLALADWLYFHGLALPDAPISVGSLLRRFSVVITFVLGAGIFHETNLPRKLLALSAIVLGTIIICLGAYGK